MKLYTLFCVCVCIGSVFSTVGKRCKEDSDCDSPRENCNSSDGRTTKEDKKIRDPKPEETTTESMEAEPTEKSARTVSDVTEWFQATQQTKVTDTITGSTKEPEEGSEETEEGSEETEEGSEETEEGSEETESVESTTEDVQISTVTSVTDKEETKSSRFHLFRPDDEEDHRSQRCECVDGYQVSQDEKQCMKPAEEDNGYYCEEDIDCELIATLEDYEYKVEMKPFCVNNSCVCGDESGWLIHSYEDADYPVCFKIPGLVNGEYECTYDQECSFLNKIEAKTSASCYNNTCKCDNDRWQILESEEGTKCEKGASEEETRNASTKTVINITSLVMSLVTSMQIGL